LKHSEIDTKKWNNCITNAVNGIVYAYSWYLDIVNEEWEALMADDYSIVMPLTRNKKYGIQYLYQPFFTQQLGVISTTVLNSNIVSDFIKAIPKHYKFYEINLNTFNKLDDFEIAKKTNITYELDLIQPYQKLAENYAQNTKRNIKKAISSKVSITNGIQPNQLIDLFSKNISEKVPELNKVHYNIIRKIMAVSLRFKIGELYGAYDSNNNLCGGAFFIRSHNKSIFLFSATTPEGKENGGMFLLIDSFIQKHSENNLTLDFEGSNIEGLARFYSSFGAKSCEYFSLQKNMLPWYYKIFKS